MVAIPVELQQNLSVVHGSGRYGSFKRSKGPFPSGLMRTSGGIVVAVDLDDVTGQTDDAFDEILRGSLSAESGSRCRRAAGFPPKSYEILLARSRSWFCQRVVHALAVNANRLQGERNRNVQNHGDQQHLDGVADP